VKTAFYKSFDRDLKDLKKNRQVLGRVQDAIEEVEEADDLRELPSLKKLSGSNRASV
jgi:mRNA-degrading endonuclease RelE of RelBE toxin-antitoxin system